MGNTTVSGLSIHVDLHNHGTPTFRAGSSIHGFVQFTTGNRPLRHGRLVLAAYRSAGLLPQDRFRVEGTLWSSEESTLMSHSVYKITFAVELPDWLPTSVGHRQQYHLEAKFDNVTTSRPFHIYNPGRTPGMKAEAEGNVLKIGVDRLELEPSQRNRVAAATPSDDYTLPSVTLGNRTEASWQQGVY
jgi:hypothetical protein